MLGSDLINLQLKALAEAGIIDSKLSCMNSTSVSDMGGSPGQGNFSFFPERYSFTLLTILLPYFVLFLCPSYNLCRFIFDCSFVSRFDLVNWKALLEYSSTSEMNEKVLVIFDNLLVELLWWKYVSVSLLFNLLFSQFSC